jgi:SEC-C motif-containing protein
MVALAPCPCGSQKLQTACCGPYIQGTLPAPTAEALMRSRYTAFCLGNVDYLVATQHPSQRHRRDSAILSHTIRTTTWQGLTILAIKQGKPRDKRGTVEFVARFRNGEGDSQLHERSRFVQENGQWFYVDGDILPPVPPKRGEPCWCGSGKKFKHCHGRG